MMPRYIVTVFERVVIECEYEIQADDPDESRAYASSDSECYTERIGLFS
jgi:hypothetical protein